MKLFILYLFSFQVYAFTLKQVDVDLGQWNFKEKYGMFHEEGVLNKRCRWQYQKQKLIKQNRCSEDLEIFEDQDAMTIGLKSQELPRENYRIRLIFDVSQNLYFYGLGTQYSHLTLNGKKFTILSEEQGNGRGKEPFSSIQNVIAKGLSGSDVTTYAASPIVISSKKEALIFSEYSYGVADFRKKGEITFSFMTDHISFEKFHASSFSELSFFITQKTGRMRLLPEWTQKGMIIGLVGGQNLVEEKLGKLKSAHVPISAVWLQDWVGVRKTNIGERLIWDWDRDEKRYPEYVSNHQYPILGYFNPFIVPLPKGVKRDEPLFEYAKSKDYLLKVGGKLYGTDMGGFKGFLVNLFMPEARQWYKEILLKKAKSENFLGWMADFGEAWPFDADVEAPVVSREAHHRYIEEWAKLNREVVDSLGAEYTFFSRSSFLKAPQYSTLFWLGDQMTTWDHHDGIQSALIGLLTSGLSGAVYNHSDIGGYASVCLGPMKCLFERERELLYRWLELNAFGVVMRTHEGLNPKKLYQVYTDEESLRWSALWGSVFKELYPYRKKYIKEASTKGVPVVRPLFYHDNQDEAFKIRDQFFLGEDMLVAPVLEKKTKRRSVYFPKGRWIHIFTGKVFNSKGGRMTIESPIGTPPVFIKPTFPKKMAQNIRAIWKKYQTDVRD